MNRRKLIIGTYDTEFEGPWTLAELSFPEPDYQENFINVPGRDGPLDMSTALTGGEPRYGARDLSARLECSEGTRAYRTELINSLVNQLDGRRMDIILPDDPDRYITGRVRIKTDYNDLAHCSVYLTARCDPWKYNKLKTNVTLVATSGERIGVLPNSGRRIVTPEVAVTGSGAKIELSCNGLTWTLREGTYRLPTLNIQPGNTALTYSGTGTAVFSYREAVL